MYPAEKILLKNAKMTELSSDEENEDVLEEEIDDLLEDNFNLDNDNTESNPSFSVNPFYRTLT